MVITPIKNTLRQISFVEIKQVSKQCDVIYAFALHIPLFVFYSYFHNIKTTRTFEHQGEAWRILVLQRYYIILNCQMLLEKTYEISCIFEKNFLPLQPRKESVCRMPRCACQHSKKDNSEFRWHAFAGIRFYVQSKTTKDAKHLGLTSFDFLPSNDGWTLLQN